MTPGSLATKAITGSAIAGFILMGFGLREAAAVKVCQDWPNSGYCPTGDGLVCVRDITTCPYYYGSHSRQTGKHVAKRRHSPVRASKQEASTQETVSRSVLGANESRIAAMNYVNADCSPGPLPVLRIVTPPKNGDFRLEELSIALNRPPGNARAKCNGTPVQAVGVFYKAKPEYAGDDAMVIDVDFRHGSVKRFIYAISVR
jgi:hypothetical protein